MVGMKINPPENYSTTKSAEKTEPISARLNERLDKFMTVVHSFKCKATELRNRILFECIFYLGIRLGEAFGLRIPGATA